VKIRCKRLGGGVGAMTETLKTWTSVWNKTNHDCLNEVQTLVIPPKMCPNIDDLLLMIIAGDTLSVVVQESQTE